jgi:hypothetical protein
MHTKKLNTINKEFMKKAVKLNVAIEAYQARVASFHQHYEVIRRLAALQELNLAGHVGWLVQIFVIDFNLGEVVTHHVAQSVEAYHQGPKLLSTSFKNS